MAALRLLSLQKGETSGAGTFTTITQAITEIDISQSILLYSYRTGGATTGPGTGSIRGYFSSVAGGLSDQLTWERNDSSSLSMTVYWWVLTFDSGIAVQHFQFTDVDDNETQTISAVDLATSFILHGGVQKGGSTYSADDGLRLSFASTTSVIMELAGQSPTDCNAAFQVVDIDDCVVTTISGSETSYTSNAVSNSYSFSDSTEEMIFGSIEHSSGSGFDDLFWLLRHGFGTIEMERAGTGSSTFGYTIFAVNFTEPGAVMEHGTESVFSGTTHVDLAISSIDTDLAVIIGKSPNNGNRSTGSYSVDDQYFTKSNFTMVIADATNADFDRGASSGATVVLAWSVMEFVESAGTASGDHDYAGAGALDITAKVKAQADFAGSGALAIAAKVKPTIDLAGAGSLDVSAKLKAALAFGGAGALAISYEILGDDTEDGAHSYAGAGALAIAAKVKAPIALAGAGSVAVAAKVTTDNIVMAGAGAVAIPNSALKLIASPSFGGAGSLSIGAKIVIPEGGLAFAGAGAASVFVPGDTTDIEEGIVPMQLTLVGELMTLEAYMTVLNIWNYALTALAIESVDSTTDDLPQAVVLAANWELFKESFLRESAWDGAKKTATLATFKDDDGTTAVLPPGRWDLAYALPSDHVRSLRLNGSENQPGLKTTSPDGSIGLWEEEVIANDVGDRERCLLTNDAPAVLEYIFLVPDSEIALLPADMRKAMAIALAAHVARMFGKTSAEIVELEAQADMAKRGAIRTDDQTGARPGLIDRSIEQSFY